MSYYARVMSGSNRTATDKTGQLFHAVATDAFPCYDKALCGKAPGIRGNGWSSWPAPQVTCPKCIERMNRESKA